VTLAMLLRLINCRFIIIIIIWFAVSHFTDCSASNRTICWQTNSCSVSWLVSPWTSQFAKMFDLKFAINNRYKCDLQYIILLNT